MPKRGEDYDEPKESYVIFICTFDPFGSGLAQYTFENLCEEDTTIHLNDGTKKIFFNAKDYEKAENEDVREFLRYVNGEKINDLLLDSVISLGDLCFQSVKIDQLLGYCCPPVEWCFHRT